MTLSNRGWKRETPSDPIFPRARVRTSRPSRAFTPARILVLLGRLVVIVLMVPHRVTIGGYHVHPGFAPYLAPYVFG